MNISTAFKNIQIKPFLKEEEAQNTSDLFEEEGFAVYNLEEGFVLVNQNDIRDSFGSIKDYVDPDILNKMLTIINSNK